MAHIGPQEDFNLIDNVSDWGVTVSEARPRRSARSIAFQLVAYSAVFVGAVLALPMLASFVLDFEVEGLAAEFAVVAAMVAAGGYLKFRTSRLPRNALQIDYSASEIRFGHERADGVFVRQRVAPFRKIEEVFVDDTPALCIRVGGELVTLNFNDASKTRLAGLAAQISAARESALRAPIRSRIQSRITGIEAGIREVRSRMRSRAIA